MKRYITTEAVSPGHPDKLCDQIADAIVQEYLLQDQGSHVACEVFALKDKIIIAGEVSSLENISHIDVAKRVVTEVGYDISKFRFIDEVGSQSAEIYSAVAEHSNPEDQGAGDQGIMFGFSCSETPNNLPLGVVLANEIAQKIVSDSTKYGPDGKSQVTIEYDEDSIKVHSVLVSIQHKDWVSQHTVITDMIPIIRGVLYNHGIDNTQDIQYIINPSGSFVLGGPEADTGLTGRKLAVDTYGGYARFGGGALSGKDPSKVDRSGAYMARYIANHIVAAGFADKCEVQLSYAIGRAEPMSINVDTLGTRKILANDEDITNAVKQVFDCRPYYIIRELHLTSAPYRTVSKQCQFLMPPNVSYPWEMIDLKKIDRLRELTYYRAK